MTTPRLAETVKGKGRHYRDPRTGELVPSVTNLLSALSKPALPRWAAKMVAEQAWALRGSLANLDEAEAVDLLKSSPWRSSTRSANRGTIVHDVLERLTTGRTALPLEGEAATYQAGVDAFLADHEVVPWQTEVTLFSSKGYAGTADFLGTVDGVPVLMDYKTNAKEALYPEVALQITALRACETMVVGDEVVDAPMTEAGLAVVISPTGYTMKQIGRPAASYNAFLALAEVWRWQHGDGYLDAWHPEDYLEEDDHERVDEPEEGS